MAHHILTAERCLAIVLAIRDLIAGEEKEGAIVTFSSDWGRNSAKVEITGRGHTHVGGPDFTDGQFIDGLYDLFVEGRGLSFVKH